MLAVSWLLWFNDAIYGDGSKPLRECTSIWGRICYYHIFWGNNHPLTSYNFGYHPGTRVLTHSHMVNVRKHGDSTSGNLT